MAFSARNLSVLAYANSFTLWHYKAGNDATNAVWEAAYFAPASDMVVPDDMIIVSGLPSGPHFVTTAGLKAPHAKPDNAVAADVTARLTKEIVAMSESGLAKWGPLNSAHEGLGVLLEEVKELSDHVYTKQQNRDLGAMRREAMDVAAVAIRFALEVCGEERGRR
jgi:NTP pyrophosphatase (non-canonical NTP hydrolase)